MMNWSVEVAVVAAAVFWCLSTEEAMFEVLSESVPQVLAKGKQQRGS
jgi:hypothetical protein